MNGSGVNCRGAGIAPGQVVVCLKSDYRPGRTGNSEKGGVMGNPKKLFWAAAVSMAVIPFASAQDGYQGFFTVLDYQAANFDQQIGYTTGLADHFTWLVGVSNDPGLSQRVDACTAEKSNVEVSIMFDTFVGGGEYGEFGAAQVFVLMMISECGADVTALVTGGGGGGGGAAAAGCVPVSTLPKGLLVDLTRSGQLTVLYDEGAFC